ncbi:MAG: diguanylate cyclase [Silanimonas lenta]
MSLDLMSLMLVSTALCLLTAGLIGYVRTAFPRRYRAPLGAWAQALVLQGLGWGAFVMRGQWPDAVTVMLANLLLLAGMQRLDHAIGLYFARPVPWRRELALLGAAFVWLLLFLWIAPDYTLRLVGMTALIAVPPLHAIATLLRRGRRPYPPALRIVVLFLALPVAVLLLRALKQLFGTPVDSIVAHDPVQIALHLTAALAPVATALGFVLMVASRLQAELAEAADTDPLTGLANRRRVEALARPWVEDPEGALSALMIDVDHFKRVNDQYGHDAGDEALVWLGSHLRVEARASDLVGRLGGEEFVMLLPGTRLAEALVLAERLRATVAATPADLGGGIEWPLTISVGVAERRPGDTEVRSLLRRADDAMYEAKRSGRNRVVAAAG